MSLPSLLKILSSPRVAYHVKNSAIDRRRTHCKTDAARMTLTQPCFLFQFIERVLDIKDPLLRKYFERWDAANLPSNVAITAWASSHAPVDGVTVKGRETCETILRII